MMEVIVTKSSSGSFYRHRRSSSSSKWVTALAALALVISSAGVLTVSGQQQQSGGGDLFQTLLTNVPGLSGLVVGNDVGAGAGAGRATTTRVADAAGRQQQQQGPLVVATAEGALMGRRENNGVNKPFRAFQGIPYARPPVGGLRFKSPERHPPWQGVKLATEYQQSCLAYFLRFIMGEEDCLYMNVFVPEGVKATNDGKGLPVVFWIHGGAFSHGSEWIPILYHPGAFTDQGVIFVTFNYRLGALGFLSMDDGVLPGNYGLKDMIMALKWVRRNIRRFGGDPDNVHIIGQSAGGVAAHALTLSPMAEGLFSSAISMSGSLLTSWGHHATGRPTARRLAEVLGCPSADSGRMLGCLRQRGAKEITSAVETFFATGGRYGTFFAPVVDSAAVDPFLPEHPLKIIAERKFQQVPFIFGNLPKEMNLFLPGALYDPVSYNKITNDWDNECGRIAYNFLLMPEANPSPADTAALCRRARSVYFGDGAVDPDGTASRISEFASDIMFGSATYAAALLQSRFSSAPVYYYSWEHHNENALQPLSFMNQISDLNLHMLYSNASVLRRSRLPLGGSHCDDITLLFNPPGASKITKNDAKVRNFISSMFKSFWNTRRPNYRGVEWPTFQPGSQKYVTFTANPQIKNTLFSSQKLKLFADWYDVMERRFRGDKPSLSRMLGLGTPSASSPSRPDAAANNEIFRTVRRATPVGNRRARAQRRSA